MMKKLLVMLLCLLMTVCVCHAEDENLMLVEFDFEAGSEFGGVLTVTSADGSTEETGTGSCSIASSSRPLNSLVSVFFPSCQGASTVNAKYAKTTAITVVMTHPGVRKARHPRRRGRRAGVDEVVLSARSDTVPV